MSAWTPQKICMYKKRDITITSKWWWNISLNFETTRGSTSVSTKSNWCLYDDVSEHSLNKVMFTISEVLESEYHQHCKETSWIWKLDTVFPKGLTFNDGFHAQVRKARFNFHHFFCHACFSCISFQLLPTTLDSSYFSVLSCFSVHFLFSCFSSKLTKDPVWFENLNMCSIIFSLSI